jgi:hypothetical protein
MSIAPVEGFPPARGEQSGNASVRSGNMQARPASGAAEAGAGEEPAQPVSGTLSKEERSAAKSVPSSYELPQDVVEVHQDPEIKHQIIIQYLDSFKDVVLQVPSAQELGVELGIAQEFQEEAKLRASADTSAAGNEGERTHGD